MTLGEWLCNYCRVHRSAMHLSFINSFRCPQTTTHGIPWLIWELKVCSCQWSPFTLYKQEYLIHQFRNINLDTLVFLKDNYLPEGYPIVFLVTQENQRNEELTRVRSGAKQRPHTDHSFIIFNLIHLARSYTIMVL